MTEHYGSAPRRPELMSDEMIRELPARESSEIPTDDDSSIAQHRRTVAAPNRTTLSSEDFSRAWGSMVPQQQPAHYVPSGAESSQGRPLQLSGPNPAQISAAPHQSTGGKPNSGRQKPESLRSEIFKKFTPKSSKRLLGGLDLVSLPLGLATGVNVLTGKSIATITKQATGFDNNNSFTFESLSCTNDPVISANVTQTADYVLNYQQVIINKDELSKSKADPKYKPQRINSFDDELGAKRSQTSTKPAPVSPYFTDKPAQRLPQSVYTGETEFGVCNIAPMSDIVSIDGGSFVEIDGSKLALTYDQTDSINTKAVIGYEKFAPKAPGTANEGYITDAEFDRIRKIVVPNEAKPAENDPKFDTSIKASMLKGLGDAACGRPIQSVGKRYVETYLQAQCPDQKFSFSWKAGAINSPYDAYLKKNAIQPDVKLVDEITTCKEVTFNGSMGDK